MKQQCGGDRPRCIWATMLALVACWLALIATIADECQPCDQGQASVVSVELPDDCARDAGGGGANLIHFPAEFVVATACGGARRVALDDRSTFSRVPRGVALPRAPPRA